MTRPLVVFVESYVAGGADRVIANLLPHLPPVPIHLIVNRRSDPSVLLAAPLPENVTLHHYEWRTPAELARWARLAPSAAGQHARRALSVALRYPVLCALWYRCLLLLRRRHPRAVLVSNGGYPGGEACRMATLAARRVPDCPVVHLVHGLAQPPRGPWRWPEDWIDRRLDRSARLVAVSQAVARSLGEQRAFRQRPLVIENGLVEGPPPTAPPGGPVLELVQVGYADRNKNQEMSIRALGLLRRQGIQDIRLTLVGKEAEAGRLEALRTLAAAEDVAPQVRFAGFVTEMDPVYAGADAVVLTSRMEGLPLALLEAMRAGRAVVTTPAGGAPEAVVHGVTGWVLEGYNPAELAAVWRRWRSDRAELAAWGFEARARFLQQYRLKVQAQRLAEALGLQPRAA
jgi:glycosyltransferase involved in cell wall biosynthesis